MAFPLKAAVFYHAGNVTVKPKSDLTHSDGDVALDPTNRREFIPNPYHTFHGALAGRHRMRLATSSPMNSSLAGPRELGLFRAADCRLPGGLLHELALFCRIRRRLAVGGGLKVPARGDWLCFAR